MQVLYSFKLAAPINTLTCRARPGRQLGIDAEDLVTVLSAVAIWCGSFSRQGSEKSLADVFGHLTSRLVS